MIYHRNQDFDVHKLQKSSFIMFTLYVHVIWYIWRQRQSFRKKMKISTADKVTIYTHAMSLSFNACHVFRRGACMQQNMCKTISFN